MAQLFINKMYSTSYFIKYFKHFLFLLFWLKSFPKNSYRKKNFLLKRLL